MFRREEEFLEKNKNISLLEQHKELQQMAEGRKETMIEKQRKEEERILAVRLNQTRFYTREKIRGIRIS